MSLNRPAVALLGTVTALAAVTGVATLTLPAGAPTAGAPPAAAARLPVERSALVCPQPSTSELAETVYTAFTPAPAEGAPDGGSAALRPAPSTLEKGGQEEDDENADAGVPAAVEEPGTPVVHETDRPDAPALAGTATGGLAPGWTVQQTTTISGGSGRGMLGAHCAAPGTAFWFPGVSTADARHDYVHLVNPDDSTATVDLRLYDTDGVVETESGTGITIPARSSVPVLLSTLASRPAENATLHVAARVGRVGAQVQALDEKLGSDWLAPAAPADGPVVVPGIPGDATEVRLTAFTPGEADIELAVRLAGPSGSFTPAGQETLHVKSGMTTAVDLADLTRGEPASLVLTPSGGADAPVMAAVRVLREEDGEQETAFVPATAPLVERATAAGGAAAGTADSTLFLTAPDSAATVRVTASAGSEGGEPVVKTYALKPGTTTAVTDLRPEGGKGRFALTVEHVSGGPVHPARMLARSEDGVPMFTVQALPDDAGTVAVPQVEQDLSVLTD
ncbi:DUF5719 family protein [Streptomyces sp. TRM 70351]|uniref:DUF5719 family protein n=1 Tax=Streptomyces sp. TRM 70351 TaxID=3116552 RepID=UPI002E7B9B46|nr:DUF5719 family protein [Streptomyces sp. TRM 70351]MEE1929316.1 DUF5719 family protein [Streptomyces sp. TRM 70351]